MTALSHPGKELLGQMQSNKSMNINVTLFDSRKIDGTTATPTCDSAPMHVLHKKENAQCSQSRHGESGEPTTSGGIRLQVRGHRYFRVLP